ncbi:MAG: segregation/condensation protein A [Bacteroidetes bacterium]|nr:segregation/condensation protein A [Bacteroidota bacterium]
MYRIQLQDFEGPLDLLLFFIRRDELDIYDIPIAHITDEYLAYVRLMEEIDLDGVADFIYMAALLINMKARMLLPRQQVDEDGEPIDPRQELVERLLEYLRFREASEQLSEAHDARADLFTRGMASAPAQRFEEEEEPAEIEDASIFELITALRGILTEAPEEPVHAVERVHYSVEAQRERLLKELQRDDVVSFRGLVAGEPRGLVIAVFLAVLELARLGDVWLRPIDGPNDFAVERLYPDEEPSTNGSISANGHE